MSLREQAVGSMTSAERLTEIAETLAKGYVRLLVSQHECQGVCPSGQQSPAEAAQCNQQLHSPTDSP